MTKLERLRILKLYSALEIYTLRHVDGLKWANIAEISGYSLRQAFYLEKEAEKVLQWYYGKQNTLIRPW